MCCNGLVVFTRARLFVFVRNSVSGVIDSLESSEVALNFRCRVPFSIDSTFDLVIFALEEQVDFRT